MQQVIADKESGYADTIQKLREVRLPRAQGRRGREVVDRLSRHLLDQGRRGPAAEDEPGGVAATYDAAVKIKAAKGGVDVTKNLSPPLV